MRMKRIYMVLALAAMAVVAGCDSLKEETLPVGDGGEVRFTTNISRFATKSGFENGDAIGIYALDRVNVRYSFSGDSLVSDDPIFWGKDGSESDMVSMGAYYPYDSDSGAQVSLKVSRDQRNKADYKRSDVLKAWAMAQYKAPVHFEFEHECARVDILIPESVRADLASVGLSDVYSVMEYEGPAYGGFGTILACDMVNEEGERVYSLILVPQESSPSLSLVYKDGEEASYEFGKSMKFESGTRYKADLLVGEDGSLKVEWSTRVFGWLEDYVSFEPTNEQWGLCGPFCNYDPASAPMLERIGPGKHVFIGSWSGSSLAFKFILGSSWAVNLGADEHSDTYINLTDPIEYGRKLNLVEGGSYMLIEKSGPFRFELNTIDNTFVFLPNELYVWYDGKAEWFKYDGDSRFVASDVLIPKESVLYAGVSGGVGFGASSSDAVKDGESVKSVVSGEAMTLAEGDGFGFYFKDGGFVDVVMDFSTGTITFTQKTITASHVLDKFPVGTEVTINEAVVYALDDKGFVISDNGSDGLYVPFGENPASLPAVGDVVRVSGVRDVLVRAEVLTDASFGIVRHGDAPVNNYIDGISWLESPSATRLLCPVVEKDGKARLCVYGWLYLELYAPGEDFMQYVGSDVLVEGWYVAASDEAWRLIVSKIEVTSEG